MSRLAAEIEGETVVVSFRPHPRNVLQPNQPHVKLLSTLEEKKERLAASGLDHLVLLDFTPEFSKLNSQQFFIEYIVNGLHTHTLMVGYNHHFGHDRLGDYERIHQMAENFKVATTRVDAAGFGDERISSSKVRLAVSAGNVAHATEMLGKYYSLSGIVEEGQRMGNKIGFPTANVGQIEEQKLIPADGVYVVKIILDEQIYFGMLNIGFRPTVDKSANRRSVEVHIFNFDANIYSHQIRVEFLQRLRNETKFKSLDELIAQLNRDKTQAINYLATNNLE
jgi:riboflavin kinase / FMN adenylyltransferase